MVTALRQTGLASACVAAGLILLACPAFATSCTGTAAGTGMVAAVRDGRTIVLTDGREVRLAGIEAGDGGALRALAGGQTLRLQRQGDDRYGRLVAYASLPDGTQPLQIILLEAGQARVSARIGDKACAERLLAAERSARVARRGLWADPNFAPLSSEDLAGLTKARGHFALVEGKVLSVRESGATIYVNFGRRWTRDFTVTIPRRERRAFAEAGIEPDKLEGRRLRARGFIELRGGPIIEAAAPEQIELTD